MSQQEAVEQFTTALWRGELVGYPPMEAVQSELRGRDLACWCSLDKPCHVDTLLDMANR